MASDCWEYRVLPVAERPEGATVEDVLNLMGGDGWELVGIDQVPGGGPQYIFKRSLAAAEPSPPELDDEEERYLRNVSTAQALMVLPEERRDEILRQVLTEDERECTEPPADFYQRVSRYLSQEKEES